MMNSATTDSTIEFDEPHWVSRAAFQVLALMLMISQLALGFAVYRENYWLAVLLSSFASISCTRC
jgi:hypothetical protein